MQDDFIGGNQRMNLKKLKEEIKKEGFKEIYEWEDKPNTTYSTHSHDYKTKLIIINGSIRIRINSENRELKAGDYIYIKANETHEAIVGNDGCKYLVGEGK